MESELPTAPQSIGRSLVFASSTASAVASALLAPHGLTLAQWAVLVCLWRNGPLSVKQVAEFTGNVPPAASRIVDRRVQGGLVDRRPDPRDRRAVVVDLTERGQALRAVERIYEDVNEVLLRDVPEAEREALFGLLHRIQANGRGWLDTAGGTRGR